MYLFMCWRVLRPSIMPCSRIISPEDNVRGFLGNVHGVVQRYRSSADFMAAASLMLSSYKADRMALRAAL